MMTANMTGRLPATVVMKTVKGTEKNFSMKIWIQTPEKDLTEWYIAPMQWIMPFLIRMRPGRERNDCGIWCKEIR